ncbi:hypothetical protein STEG23_003605 [Scotinomys teguina]
MVSCEQRKQKTENVPTIHGCRKEHQQIFTQLPNNGSSHGGAGVISLSHWLVSFFLYYFPWYVPSQFDLIAIPSIMSCFPDLIGASNCCTDAAAELNLDAFFTPTIFSYPRYPNKCHLLIPTRRYSEPISLSSSKALHCPMAAISQSLTLSLVFEQLLIAFR